MPLNFFFLALKVLCHSIFTFDVALSFKFKVNWYFNIFTFAVVGIISELTKKFASELLCSRSINAGV